MPGISEVDAHVGVVVPFLLGDGGGATGVVRGHGHHLVQLVTGLRGLSAALAARQAEDHLVVRLQRSQGQRYELPRL